METKRLTLDSLELRLDTDAMKFQGYASVFGGIDAYGDTIDPKAYEKTLKRKSSDRPIRLRWNHFGPVIGKWVDMVVDSKGLLVTGELTPGHSVAMDAYASMKHGAVDGLSIGFYPKQIEMLDGENRRLLKEIELVEISVVEEPADLGARVSAIKAASKINIERAVTWLKRAIKLHEGHMDGSVPTSDESQMKMMEQMKKALSYLMDDTDDDMSPMKHIERAKSLKEIETLLREAGGFSRADAVSLVARIKSMCQSESDAEMKAKNELRRLLSESVFIPS